MLPLLPLYISFFAGTETENRRNNASTVLRAISFVLGFTTVFCALGLFAGTLGMLLSRYRQAVNIISGIIVCLLGLSFLGVFQLPSISGKRKRISISGIVTAFLFGLVYSVSLTPCVGAFLGAALMLASHAGSAVKGLLLLLAYSMGLGIPFILSALLIDRLRDTIQAIKKHYRIINIICGTLLIVMGISMMLGWLSSFLSLFA